MMRTASRGWEKSSAGIPGKKFGRGKSESNGGDVKMRGPDRFTIEYLAFDREQGGP